MAMLALVAGSRADDKKDEKIDAKKLIGKWEPEDAKEKVSMEFTKDGKLTILAGNGKEFSGTYKVDGKKLTFSVKSGEMEITKTVTILKLTDDEFTGEADMGKKTMKRVKEKKE
jgi:uncharacterized protein (TIGR03066 family)